MNGQLSPAFPIGTAQLLHDITGEPEPARALYQTLRDAVEHRLEKIEELIDKLEKKYRLTFNQFKKQWLAGKINKKYGYPVEKDYWEWEGLTSRYQKLKISLQWLP